MRKLARNIITGTALAVGGLAPAGATETAERQSQSNTAATMIGVGGLGVSAVGLVTSLIANNKQAKLSQEANTEAKRHNEKEETRNERETAGKLKLEAAGLNQEKAQTIAERIRELANDSGGKNQIKWETVAEAYAKGGKLQRLLNKIAEPNAWTADDKKTAILEYATMLRGESGANLVLRAAEWLDNTKPEADDMKNLLQWFGVYRNLLPGTFEMWRLNTANITTPAPNSYGHTIPAAASAIAYRIAGGNEAALAAPPDAYVPKFAGKEASKLAREFGNKLLPDQFAPYFKDCFPASLILPGVADDGTGEIIDENVAGGNPAKDRGYFESRIGDPAGNGLNAAAIRARNDAMEKGKSLFDIMIGSDCMGKNAPGANMIAIPLCLSEKAPDGLSAKQKSIRKKLGHAVVASLTSSKKSENGDNWIDE